jgi:hypothetical protein
MNFNPDTPSARVARISYRWGMRSKFRPARVAEERDNRRGKSGEASKGANQSPNKALPQSLKKVAVAGRTVL